MKERFKIEASINKVEIYKQYEINEQITEFIIDLYYKSNIYGKLEINSIMHYYYKYKVDWYRFIYLQQK